VSYSMWLITVTALSGAAADSLPAGGADQPAPMVRSDVQPAQMPGYTVPAAGYAGYQAQRPMTLPPSAGAPVNGCDGCNSCNSCNTCGDGCERPRLFARLACRLGMLFHRRSQCSDTCADCTPCTSCTCHRGLGIREFFRRLFHRGCHERCDINCQCCQPCSTPAAPPPPPPPPPPVRKMPEAQKTVLQLPPPMEIKKEYLDRVGNAPDYSWVTGQLFYVHAGDGLWVVRYAPIDREDRYGGSIVLAPIINMDSFQDGDLVTVRGEILNEGRAVMHLGGPLYRATDLTLRDRTPVRAAE
jgi:hypothetical protein